MLGEHEHSESTGQASVVTETRVSFGSADGSVTLAGTLALPSRGRFAPAVVLVSGTGPMDRDVTFAGHALFRVMAHSLARAGIASLRFDKRGVGKSGGHFPSAGPDDFVADVLGARAYLLDREGFPNERTGLVGHSEGGIVALSAGSMSQDVPFCVLLASPLLSGRDNAVRSFALMAHGSLERADQYERHVSDLAPLFEIARRNDRAEQDPHALEIASRLAPRIFSDRTAAILGANSLSGAQFLDFLASPYLETVLAWDPSRIVALVTCPVLAIYASDDVQVPSRENLAAARALLGRLGKNDWVLEEMRGMNHAFQRCATGMPDEYASIDQVMADEVIEVIASWIGCRLRS